MLTVRSASRALLMSRGPTFVVVATLAVAIGAATIIASTIDGVLRAIPAIDTTRLVFVASTDPNPSQAQSGMTGNLAMTGTSVPDLVDWTARTTTVALVSATAAGLAVMDARSPVTQAAVLVAIAVAALGAAYVPARRAARIDPLRALRTEQ
jgi:ABC-type antimicrobial peptide transport system permease subunit